MDTVILFDLPQVELNQNDSNIPRCNETCNVFVIVVKNTGFCIVFFLQIIPIHKQIQFYTLYFIIDDEKQYHVYIYSYKMRFLRYKKAGQNLRINHIMYMILLYKFIGCVSILHYSYRKYEKLSNHYAQQEQINEEQRKINVESTISFIKCTERYRYRNLCLYFLCKLINI